MTLDASSDAPIDVVLSSADGTLEAAFALIDVVDAAHAPIRLRCQGQVAGPAIGVVAAADRARFLDAREALDYGLIDAVRS